MEKVLNVLIGLVCATAIGLSGWTLQKVTVLAERMSALEVRVPLEYPPKAFRDEVDRRFTMLNEMLILRVSTLSEKVTTIDAMLKENNQMIRDIRDETKAAKP